jgi:nicotinamide-nucleotide amidase
VVEALRMLMDLARGPQPQIKPRRADPTRLRPRVTRSPRRHVVKRRPPRSPRG